MSAATPGPCCPSVFSPSSHGMSEHGRMTDTERDQIDQDAQTFMRTCAEAIQQLRAQAHRETHSQQVREHRSAVLDFVEDYLRRVCKLYSEQRAVRVKRVVDKKRLAQPRSSAVCAVIPCALPHPPRTASCSSAGGHDRAGLTTGDDQEATVAPRRRACLFQFKLLWVQLTFKSVRHVGVCAVMTWKGLPPALNASLPPPYLRALGKSRAPEQRLRLLYGRLVLLTAGGQAFAQPLPETLRSPSGMVVIFVLPSGSA
ncbi:Syntaxin-18 [Galemys pyrenaicus]|uniref:Syntaxin-18 n=1 Tax=Galemys pyrenaicus TaxID=202257 RepID=A0A8J6DGX9_GALPY|nr:Syntaxin-18 [Galemys pyrenaicus]